MGLKTVASADRKSPEVGHDVPQTCNRQAFFRHTNVEEPLLQQSTRDDAAPLKSRGYTQPNFVWDIGPMPSGYLKRYEHTSLPVSTVTLPFLVSRPSNIGPSNIG